MKIKRVTVFLLFWRVCTACDHHDLRRRQASVDNHVAMCGAEDPTPKEKADMAKSITQWVNQNKQRNLQATSYVIPVSTTAFTANKDHGILTDVDTAAIVDALNHGYRNTPFQFQLLAANNILNVEYAQCKQKKDFFQQYAVANHTVLNMFFCNTVASDQVAGVSRLPVILVNPETAWEDGVMLMNPRYNETDAYTVDDMAQIAVHEVGHWLGLMHTFTDSCETRKTYQREYDGIMYYYQNGDGVADTPGTHYLTTCELFGKVRWQGAVLYINTPTPYIFSAHFGPTILEKMTAYCWQGQGLDTCKGQSFVDQGLDPVSNYMNYLPPECFRKFGLFTPGQMRRAVAQYEMYRLRNVTFVDLSKTAAPTETPSMHSR
jgi:hypothetical protein